MLTEMSTNFVTKIEDCINKNNDKNAVSYYNGIEWTNITYELLNAYANEISTNLKKINGNVMSYVLLYLKITATFPILILGALKADQGFICLEEDHEEDLNHYLSKLNISCIISNIESKKWKHTLLNSITLKEKFKILSEVVSLWFTNANGTIFNEGFCALLGQKFMYAIKTSGTTGLSKLVQVTEDCLLPNIKDLSEILQIRFEDIILLMTPVTFDPSLVEVFLSLCNGCTLCILDKQIKEDPQKIIDILFPSPGGIISILQLTPSILKRWNYSVLRKHIFHSTSSLRAVILGGEEFPSFDELLSWGVSPHISVYNIYGITEVSCWAAINKVWPSKELSNDIGNPLSKTLLKVVCEEGSHQGELWIGSETRICLVGDENYEETFKTRSPVFRPTGDIFKNDNGKLYFIGRKDDVLKRWGTRICLSEIERTARMHDNVGDCSCISIKLADHIKVGLFVVLNVHTESLQSIKDLLKEKLPRSSWPDLVEAIPLIPLTKHGKVCKETLRKMCTEQRRPTRECFNELWSRYTNTKGHGTLDFLSSGGNSFTALQFFNELRTEFGELLGSAFFDLLLNRKTQDELWQYIDSSTNNRLPPEENTKNVKCNNEVKFESHVDSKSFCDTVSIAKTYLKGKVSVFGGNLQDNMQYGLNENCIHKINLEELFKHNIGKCVDASPLGITFSNQRHIIIVGSHSGHIVVLDLDDLQVISNCTLPDRVESSACISNCGNFYYIGCYDGCLYSISMHSGNLLWKFHTGDMIKSTAIFHEGDIVFGSYDKYVYRLDKEGNVKWKRQLKSPILAEIIAKGNMLYSATLGSLAALNFNSGEILWEHCHIPIFSSPVFYNDCLIVADVKGKVQWLNLNTAKEENSFEAGGMIFSSLVIRIVENEEILIFGCEDCYIYCLKDRKLHWKTLLESKVVSTPFVEPYLKFLVVFSSVGKAYILNFTSGEKICEYSLPGEVFSSPIIMENKIIIGCRDDNVYVLQIKSY